MSEEERRKRTKYRILRRQWITVQTVAVIVILTLSLLCAILAHTLNKTYYVNYSEKSSVDYGVTLKENDFYEDSYLGKDYAYIASLIDKVQAKFNYNITMDSQNPVDFVYSYRIDAVVQIKNKTTGAVLYAPVYNELPMQKYTSYDNDVAISETVLVDYAKYNSVAKSFINAYSLSGATAELTLQMKVNVKGSSEEFYNDENSNSYVASISIPLTSQTVEIKMTSAIPKAEDKILSFTTEKEAGVLKVIAIVLAIVGGVLLLFLSAFAYLSRNCDITYDIRVSRLLRNYKSFIQKLKNAFDTAGYQLLFVDSFNEMLDIRDIIQSPILMNENEDRTCTRFVIPTNTKLLYVFDLKVDDYDEIYKDTSTVEEVTDIDEDEENKSEITLDVINEAVPEAVDTAVTVVAEESVPVAEEEPVEAVEEASEPTEEPAEAVEEVSEPTEEPAEVVEEASELTEEPAEAYEEVSEPTEEPAEAVEEASEPTEEPAVSMVIGEEDGIVIDGKVVHIRYRSSFTSRLIQAGQPLQRYYTEIKNHIMSYKGVKARTSWACETFNKGRVQLIKLNVKGKTIHLSLALDPKEYIDTKYRLQESSDEKLPSILKIKSERGVKYAVELINAIMEKASIVKGKIPEDVYYMPYETNRMLAKRGLVRIILPKGITLTEDFDIREADVSQHITSSNPHGTVVTNPETILAIAKEEEVDVTVEEVKEAIEAPTPELDEIDFVDEVDEEYEESEDKPGVEVIGVVWPEHEKKNKIYRYDPNGEVVDDGDIVLVPSRDAHKKKDIVRKAAVAHGNHKVDPDTLTHPLKKIIAVVKRKTQEALMGEGKKGSKK